MKLEEQKQRLPIANILSDEHKTNSHGSLLPERIRAIICGPSGCGKTNVLLSLLLHRNGLKFKNIYLFGKTLHQPKYRYLQAVLERTPEIGFYTSADSNELPENIEGHSVIIFDDMTLEDQNNIRRFFSYGRHNDLDCFYLTQSYVCIPRHLIRCNVNFLILFKQDELNLRHIYEEHISSTGLSFSTFKSICSLCWKEPYGFLVIDMENGHGRFRKGFDTFIVDI